MAAAANANYELANFEAERKVKAQQPPRRPGQPVADVVIKHAAPQKPFREMTLGDYNAHLAAQGLKGGVIG